MGCWKSWSERWKEKTGMHEVLTAVGKDAKSSLETTAFSHYF